MKHPGLCFTARRLTPPNRRCGLQSAISEKHEQPYFHLNKSCEPRKSQNLSDARRAIMIAVNVELTHRIGMGLKGHDYEGVGRKT
jgi:hypothetical protein